jgi:hypothetical protein
MAAGDRKNADEALVLALASGATVEAAARQCDLCKRTVYRWVAEPRFKRRLQEVRSDMVQRTAGMPTAASMEAVKTLLELQKTPAPAAVRLGAARSVIELGTKLRDTADFEARLPALEQRIGPKRNAWSSRAGTSGTGSRHDPLPALRGLKLVQLQRRGLCRLEEGHGVRPGPSARPNKKITSSEP